MSKIVVLFFIFNISCFFSQQNQYEDSSTFLNKNSVRIDQLTWEEDSLLFSMKKVFSQFSDAIQKEISFLTDKKSNLAKFLVAMNETEVDNRSLSEFSLADASRIIDLLSEYASLDEYRLQIQLVQKELSKQKDQIVDNSDSLPGAHRIKYRGTFYNLYITDLKNEEINLHQKKGSLSIASVKKKLESKKRKVKMITNAGMYTKKCDPEGLYIQNGVEHFAIDTGSSETTLNFYMHPNGVFYVDSLNRAQIKTTKEFLSLSEAEKGTINLATQSGPMLLIDGKIHPRFNRWSESKKLRSGVGVFGDKLVFAITEGTTNFFTFASFFQDHFGCSNALFLDGTISKMYLTDGSSKDMGGAFGPIISISEK